MPAAAVIPAPIAYVKVVAVEKLVVGLLLRVANPPSGDGLACLSIFSENVDALDCVVRYLRLLL